MKPSTFQTLEMLRSQPYVTTHDLLEGGCGSRYGARLNELRDDFACDWDREQVRAGSWRYWLLSEPIGLTSKSEPSDGWAHMDRVVRWADELAVTGVVPKPIAGQRGIAASRSESQKKATPAPVVPVTAKTLPAGVVPVRAHTRRVTPVTGPEQLALEVA